MYDDVLQFSIAKRSSTGFLPFYLWIWSNALKMGSQRAGKTDGNDFPKKLLMPETKPWPL